MVAGKGTKGNSITSSLAGSGHRKSLAAAVPRILETCCLAATNGPGEASKTGPSLGPGNGLFSGGVVLLARGTTMARN